MLELGVLEILAFDLVAEEHTTPFKLTLGVTLKKLRSLLETKFSDTAEMDREVLGSSLSACIGRLSYGVIVPRAHTTAVGVRSLLELVPLVVNSCLRHRCFEHLVSLYLPRDGSEPRQLKRRCPRTMTTIQP